ncbi:restriction endonuclease subunit S [Acinetobacter sp. YH12116]|uniref:restriction endonuclease subunit S n=1 Tax=Acinetobacter sp. YH12116 TaxID=2601103 RepID=UPI0015D1279D|nr:restriction endonuclease subunit S [Acinetobacter sp. YH12116]
MAVPKLRFKEFDGDWTSKQLGKIIGISSASRVFKEQWQDSGVPFFRTSDVVSIFKNKENEKAYISLELFEELAKKSGKIKQGDLLVTGGGSIGIPYLVPNDQPLYFKDADLLWMKSSGIVEGSFLYNFFISPKFREYLKSISHTGTISHFTIEQAKATPFGFPSKEEQTKIASFLSNVDEKISQLTQKHQLLSQYKQGMMQKLFSQQFRFKADDGGEFAKWQDSKLGELTTLITKGTTPSSLGEKYEESGINFIKIESLSSNGKFLLDKFAYIDENTHNKLARSKLEHDDILFSIAGALGRVAIISRDYLPANTNQALAIIRLKDKKITRYIYYFLNSDYVKKIIDAESVQLAQANFSLGQLANLDVLVPCLEEQTKIANFLSAIDQKIEVVAQQIEQAKQWKKGLLQQMFV